MTPVSKPVIKQEESSYLDHIHIRGAAEEKTATEPVSTVLQEEPWPEMENLNKRNKRTREQKRKENIK